MDINQVKFGSYSIANSNTASKNHEAPKKDLETASSQENVKQFSADEVFSALTVAGMQNKAQINAASKKEVNPADYLSADRIAEIEAMMGKFDDGVQMTANIVGSEFPKMSESNKLALAAQIFAQE